MLGFAPGFEPYIPIHVLLPESSSWELYRKKSFCVKTPHWSLTNSFAFPYDFFKIFDHKVQKWFPVTVPLEVLLSGVFTTSKSDSAVSFNLEVWLSGGLTTSKSDSAVSLQPRSLTPRCLYNLEIGLNGVHCPDHRVSQKLSISVKSKSYLKIFYLVCLVSRWDWWMIKMGAKILCIIYVQYDTNNGAHLEGPGVFHLYRN